MNEDELKCLLYRVFAGRRFQFPDRNENMAFQTINLLSEMRGILTATCNSLSPQMMGAFLPYRPMAIVRRLRRSAKTL
jgi:hypothetical protein